MLSVHTLANVQPQSMTKMMMMMLMATQYAEPLVFFAKFVHIDTNDAS